MEGVTPGVKIELNKSERKFAMMSQTRTRSTFQPQSLALQFAAHLSNDAYSSEYRVICLEVCSILKMTKYLAIKLGGLPSSGVENEYGVAQRILSEYVISEGAKGVVIDCRLIQRYI